MSHFWMYQDIKRSRISELLEFLQRYDPNLTIIYNSWDEMYYLYEPTIICHGVLFFEEESIDVERDIQPLTVGRMIDILRIIAEDLEVSTYSFLVRRNNTPTLHSQLLIKNIYFR
jgi:hypothetical protein